MNQRTSFGSGAIWEDQVGYSRAVRIGNVIEVSGTVALQNGQIVGENDPYVQTKRILELIVQAIESLGGSVEDVIRTRIFVTDISRWEEVGRAHGEVFAEIKPATTMVEVRKLIDPAYMVEIEASAAIHP